MTTRPRSAYLLPVTVRFHECDPLGHVNNAVYLHYLEQAAIDHAAEAGWPQERLEAEVGAVFMAARHEIDYLRPAVAGDRLVVVTWPERMGMATALRRYVIRRAAEREPVSGLVEAPDIDALAAGDVAVRALTRWALVRLDSGRPVRIPPVVVDDFIIEERET
jgi:YbgC/YbaW family acyl-CoA thioester hydrolase